jgi:tetratricopeptide (TPR) repeat protein
MQDYDNALIHLDRGATLGLSGSSQSLQQARYTYGALLVRAGEFDRASEVLMAALGGELQDADKVQDALGLALLRQAQLPAPESTPLVSAAGRIAVLLRQSKYDDAFALFRPLLAEYPSAPFLHYAYGTALLALSQYDEAAAQMRLELAISPSSELPCVRLASIALRRHDAPDAIAWSRRALALNTNSAEAHYLLGRASLEAGDDATALRELLAASKLSPASPEIHFNLAKAYARARMPEQADQERRTFADLNALAEAQRNMNGGVYSGPRDPREITGAPQTKPAQPIPSRGP